MTGAVRDTVTTQETLEPVGAGLSTQRAEPASPPPVEGDSPLVVLRQAWRQLTSMRTALLLLFLLALASVPGSLLPQRGVNPLEVATFARERPTLAPVLDRFHAFDVYASPWFAAVYLLLFVSLIGCLTPRIRLHARALRAAPPPAPRVLSRLRDSARWSSPDPVADTVARAERVLRRGRWRVVRREEPGGAVALAAEKGYLRETGNLVFHLSLVLLLLAVAAGAVYGYRGTVVVEEGEGFANASVNYDDLVPGRAFDATRLEPFTLTVERFQAVFAENGQPLDFAADVAFTPDLDEAARAERLRVNEPLTAGSARVFLLGHGYAPVLRVVDSAGDVVFEGPQRCLPQDLTFASTCVLKVPDAAGPPGTPPEDAQLGFRANFAPTAQVEQVAGRTFLSSAHPELRSPALDVVAYRGDLGLELGLPQNVYQLQTVGMEEIGSDFLTPGETWELPGGGSLEFLGVQRWVNLQVTSDPGKVPALLASVGVIAGLTASLTVRRRRVWVRVRPGTTGAGAAGEPGGGGGPTLVEVGGLSRHGSDEQSAEELAGLVERLGGTPEPRVPRPAAEQEKA